MAEEKNTIEENKEDLNKENKDKSEDKKAEIKKEISPEEKIVELEDKLTRSFAELENQRRRFEKEKDEAFDYGGMVFARDALNLLDNLERSKQSINNDQNLDENSKKKIIDHIEIILNECELKSNYPWGYITINTVSYTHLTLPTKRIV